MSSWAPETREERLRLRIDALLAEREVARMLIGERATASFRRCPWCGKPCYGRACVAHRDVEQIIAGMGA